MIKECWSLWSLIKGIVKWLHKVITGRDGFSSVITGNAAVASSIEFGFSLLSVRYTPEMAS